MARFDGRLRERVFWVLTAGLTGVVGSAAWEYVAPRVWSWIVLGLLNFVTLGIDSIRDTIYAEISKGNESYSSMYIFVGLSAFFVADNVLKCYRYHTFLKGLEPKYLEKNYTSKFLLSNNNLLYLTIIINFLMTTQILQITYTNSVIISARQLSVIIAPYLTENERLNFSSRLARSSGREYYVNTIIEMQEIAKRNNIQSPKIILF